jgi:hypothetical protein
MHLGDRGRDIGRRRVGCEVATHHEAQLVLETGRDKRVAAEDIAGIEPPFGQEATEDRLVHAELLLDRARRQPDLPADPARARPAVDQRQLNAIGVVERQPVEPGAGKIFAARPRRLELADRGADLLVVHQYTPGTSRAVWRQ